MVPESRKYRLKKRLLGPPLSTETLEDQRLGKPTALAVFASDNLSSAAYATEEILRVLVPVIGIAAFSLVVPVTGALLIVLAFLILSYRQTIREYPSAGGAYVVTKDNLGKVPSLVAGVSLLTDYILTVAVSVAAGTAALASAVPTLTHVEIPLSIMFVALIALGNLRGVKESGRVFAVPTYFFLINMAVLLGYGISQSTRYTRTGYSVSVSPAMGCCRARHCSSSCARSRLAAPRSPELRRSRMVSRRSGSRRGRTLARRS